MIYLAPLVIPAIVAYRGPSRTFLTAANRAWPICSLLVFVLSATALGATPLHAWEGITLPLSVLAVQGARDLGWQRLRHRRALTVAALALLTIPGGVLQLNSERQLAAPTADDPNFIRSDEQRALRYLSELPTPGGVLTSPYLGPAVPELTGRRTFIGDCLWSQPNCLVRSADSAQIFDGTFLTAAAQRFVRATGARFVLADCETQADLATELAPLIVNREPFGCATVYELRPCPRRKGLWQNCRPMRLFALRGAHSVERNERDQILGGHGGDDARIDGAQRARRGRWSAAYSP